MMYDLHPYYRLYSCFLQMIVALGRLDRCTGHEQTPNPYLPV